MEDVSFDIRDSFAVITMNRPPVNTLNTSMWTKLRDALESLEANKNIRGVIFRSGLTRSVFTSGNDILELYAPRTTKEKYKVFWKTQNRFLASLYNSRLLTVCAIRGACPAAGTGIAMCCDVRIATSDSSLGLNESALGIAVPEVWGRVLARTVPYAKAEQMAMFGSMISAAEARSCGLVHEIVSGGDMEVMEASVKKVGQLLKVPDLGRVAAKRNLRKELFKEWADEGRLDKEAEGAWAMLSNPKTVKSMDAVMARLSKAKL